jgi:hypothetical protein
VIANRTLSLGCKELKDFLDLGYGEMRRNGLFTLTNLKSVYLANIAKLLLPRYEVPCPNRFV